MNRFFDLYRFGMIWLWVSMVLLGGFLGAEENYTTLTNPEGVEIEAQLIRLNRDHVTL